MEKDGQKGVDVNIEEVQPEAGIPNDKKGWKKKDVNKEDVDTQSEPPKRK